LNPNRRLEQVAHHRGWPVRRFRSRGTPGLGEVVRSVLAYGSVLPSAAIGLTAGVLSGSRREGLNVMGSIWGELAISLAGVSVRVKGEEYLWKSRPAVFIFNHQSVLDAMVCIKLLRKDITAVAKKELQQNPIFGPIFTIGGVAFIDRSDTKKAIESMKPAVEALRHGVSLVVFPEGTRSETGRLQPFKKGAFHIAMQAGVPIVPVVLKNTVDAMPKSAMVLRPATVEVEVLPPVDTSGWTKEGLEDEIHAIRKEYLRVLAS